jgi:ribosomal protein S18 acetylase RimI-like enzyme
MEIRPIVTSDREALADFFARVPEGDRTFFKEDVLDARVVDAWAEPRSGDERLVAVEDTGEIVGWMALSGGVGWSAHVGDLRLVVAPTHRRRGLGRALAQRALIDALQRGYSKIAVELIADQTGAIGMFTELGFDPEALLVDHVRDRTGDLRDLLVLAHHADDVSGELAAIGINAELRA